MTVHAPVFPLGTRVRVREGRLPMDSRLVGREGTVVAVDPYSPERYGILLDGESEAREFAQDELVRPAD